MLVLETHPNLEAAIIQAQDVQVEAGHAGARVRGADREGHQFLVVDPVVGGEVDPVHHLEGDRRRALRPRPQVQQAARALHRPVAHPGLPARFFVPTGEKDEALEDLEVRHVLRHLLQARVRRPWVPDPQRAVAGSGEEEPAVVGETIADQVQAAGQALGAGGGPVGAPELGLREAAFRRRKVEIPADPIKEDRRVLSHPVEAVVDELCLGKRALRHVESAVVTKSRDTVGAALLPRAHTLDPDPHPLPGFQADDGAPFGSVLAVEKRSVRLNEQVAADHREAVQLVGPDTFLDDADQAGAPAVRIQDPLGARC